MKELKFASEEDALQYLADLIGQKVCIGGSVKGPGIPDGTGPMSGTSSCPMTAEEEEEEEIIPQGRGLGRGMGRRTGPQDGTGPRAEEGTCPLSKTSGAEEDEDNPAIQEMEEAKVEEEEEGEMEGDEDYLKQQKTSDARKVVIEKEGDMFEAEVYVLKDDKWKPKEAHYFGTLAEAEAKFNELLSA
jgi:hypothetical protein